MPTLSPPHQFFCLWIPVVILFCCPVSSGAQTFFVSTGGNDAWPGTELLPWRTVQKACNSGTPGSTVFITRGTYNEKVTVNVSGNATDGFITLRNQGADTVVLDGTGIPGQNIIFISGKNYLRIIGLTIRNNTGVTDGSGVRIEGVADHVELRNLTIHEMRGQNAMGITCYGTSGTAPIRNLVIDGNTIFDCDAAPSEALALNGNVEKFVVTNNTVHDVNNIGIVFIGGEGTCPVGSRDRARDGICRGNHVYGARSIYGGGYAAGIYVDGGRAIVVENNIVHENDLGIEIGCENHGESVDSVVVRNNIVYNNDKRGISFGGYNFPSTGQVRACQFLNNTLFRNDVLGTGDGEFVVEYALDCQVHNNIVVATSQNILLSSTVGSGAGNAFNHNLWDAPAGSNGAVFVWGGTALAGFPAYRAATGQDAGSLFGDPVFLAPVLPSPDLHIPAVSPAVDAGWDAFVPDSAERDIDGEPRVIGLRVDVGADELAAPPESPIPLSPDDGVAGLPPEVNFSWSPVPLASRYHLQVASDSAFTSVVLNDSLIPTPTVTAGPCPPSSTSFWRIRAGNSVGESPWSSIRRFSTTDFEIRSYHVAEGWNLLSLPLQVFDRFRFVVYPMAISPAYMFSPVAGYQPSDTLDPRLGFWLKFAGEGDVLMSGRARLLDTLDVGSGWNIVGTLSVRIAVDSVVADPPEILQSAFFAYGGTYVPADSLVPSRGYWVKAGGPGRLILRSAPPPVREIRYRRMRTTQRPH